MLLTQHSFAFSFSGHLGDDHLPVPPANIRQANAIYFFHLALIEDLCLLDSLHQEHTGSLQHEISLQKKENKVNDDLILNLNLRLETYESVNQSLITQNRLLWGGIILLSSYIILR